MDENICTESLALCSHGVPVKLRCLDCIVDRAQSTKSMSFRLFKIEELLAHYLKPNTRDDLDRLEQRFKVIEYRLSTLKHEEMDEFNKKVFFKCQECKKPLGNFKVLEEYDGFCFICNKCYTKLKE
jgi:hypothetical protein